VSRPGAPESACPCGKPLQLAQCCGRYVGDFAGMPAPDAESLMRSRYTAFVLMDRDYLLATWHPQTRPADLALDPGAKWLGLDVRSRKRVDATHAEVEFVARCREPGGKAVRIHERSRFVQENGRWFYLDGDMT
jgi:SEC-C motif-containing protein